MRYVTTLSLLVVILVSPAASQPPTLAEQPLVIEGRVLWVDFGSETLMLAPVEQSRPMVDIEGPYQSAACTFECRRRTRTASRAHCLRRA